MNFLIPKTYLKKKVFTLGFFVTIFVFSSPVLCKNFVQIQKKISTSKTIRGYAKVIDGDSIVISNIMVRLSGIDAPELGQFCGIKNERYPCGLRAKKNLEKLISNRMITCHWNKRDKYHRIIATCRTKDINNINAAMVHKGWAVSYYEYPREEKEAREEKRGIWRSYFQRPQQWRKSSSYRKIK
ncbi:thermonuclease family protein [Bartonella ancashensis]|uniref:Succinoglycan biosynthesis protein n=1 Tax=Bartonella ancashensis TaxID=1318743 RepID=A0A0M5KSP4_9HYPH|nr:thermonuclease family protein [Bartonella ancashensis]ALE03753.1 succinoglycan biosynthesis protein [Bartonella ancashensis]